MKPRGMREIATGRRVQRQGVPQSRQQAINELARLEHEKVRLERELEIWRANERRAEARMMQVDLRLVQLQEVLGLRAADAPVAPAAAPERRTSPGWAEFSLEY